MSQMDSQLAADIHASIHSLNQLLHEAGVDVSDVDGCGLKPAGINSERCQEICKVLERVLQSPDQVTALYHAFNTRLKRLSNKGKPDQAYVERYEWFRNFSSKDGIRLAPKKIETLARITSSWKLSEEQIKTLAACSVIWTINPELFWYGDTTDGDIIRRCYNDLRRMEDVDPLRRRVVLMILAQHVEQEQDLLRSKGRRVRSRPRQKQSNRGRSRKRVLLPSAISSLTKDLWPQVQPEKQKNIRKRLTTDSLHGWKWRQLARAEMALSLQDAATKKFERYSWSPIEVEAIDRYMETLPQFEIHQRLHGAMSSIVSYYSENKSLNRAHPGNTSHSFCGPLEAIATMTPESQLCDDAETPLYHRPPSSENQPSSDDIRTPVNVACPARQPDTAEYTSQTLIHLQESCQNLNSTGVSLNAESEPLSHPRETHEVGNRFLDTHYRRSPQLQIPLELARLPPPCSAYTTVDLRENRQPMAPNPDSYSFVDWERDFFLLDWDRDIDYTLFQFNNGQNQ